MPPATVRAGSATSSTTYARVFPARQVRLIGKNERRCVLGSNLHQEIYNRGNVANDV